MPNVDSGGDLRGDLGGNVDAHAVEDVEDTDVNTGGEGRDTCASSGTGTSSHAGNIWERLKDAII